VSDLQRSRTPYREAQALSTTQRVDASLPLHSATVDGDNIPELRWRTFALMAFGVYGSLLAGFYASPLATLLCFLVAMGATALWRHRKIRRYGEVTLRVVDDRLLISSQNQTQDVALASVASIRLCAETEEAFRIDGYGVRTAPPIASGNGRSLLEICTDDSARIQLLAVPISHSEAIEWIPQIHRFLRSNGWVPPEESASAAIEPMEEEEPASIDETSSSSRETENA
jgi:hypothetical protein